MKNSEIDDNYKDLEKGISFTQKDFEKFVPDDLKRKKTENTPSIFDKYTNVYNNITKTRSYKILNNIIFSVTINILTFYA